MIPKFRAWDNNRKLMIDEVVVIDLYHEYIGYLYPSKIVQGEIVSRLPINDVIIMQSTGLFDKNGKEIFEGDIVATDLERPYLIVEKHRSYFLYNCNDGDDDYYDFMLPLYSYQDSQDYFAEVIGNIYENPELLEVEDE